MPKTAQRLDLEKVAILPVVRYKGTIIPEPYIPILALIGEGWSNIEIGDELGFSIRTIEGFIRKIRDLVASITDERLTERRLVIFGRDMLDGYQAFLRLREQPKLNTWNDIELIEDWDDDNEDEEEDFPGLDIDEPHRPQDNIVDLRQFRHDYEITRFEAEERELIYANGTHYLV